MDFPTGLSRIFLDAIVFEEKIERLFPNRFRRDDVSRMD